MCKNRYLTKYTLEDLSEKMAFVGGPRQVGKATLAREFVAPHFDNAACYDWDSRKDR
jgi:predicted AAA+ superfamily ATPase